MLKTITVDSIYANKALPARMAQCTPDMALGIEALAEALKAKGAKLVLSDLFRSYEMQFQAHLDYTSGKKKAFSPAPGGSMHEAGRAMDISLEDISPLTLEEFWDIAKPLGFMPIIAVASTKVSEAWHFDFRGSFQKIYDYSVIHDNGVKPYAMMAALAILEQGITVDALKGKETGYLIQSALVRVGCEIGKIDGSIGPKCIAALELLGYKDSDDLSDIYSATRQLMRLHFPLEN